MLGLLLLAGLVASALSATADVSDQTAAIMQARARFEAAYLKGWESQNPIKVGDTVLPGLHWDPSGHPDLAAHDGVGLRGVVVSGPAVSGEGPGGPASYTVEWALGEADVAIMATALYGAGVYQVAVATTTAGLGAVTIVERVARMAWTPGLHAPFAEHAAGQDLPVVLEGTAATTWPAMTLWTPESLLANVTSDLDGVKVQSGGRPMFYFHRAPMNGVPELVDDYKAKTFSKHSMPGKEFLERIAAKTTTTAVDETVLRRAARSDGDLAPPHVAGLRYAWAGKLDVLGEERLAQVLPLDPLMVLSPEFDPKNENLFRSTFVWVSPQNTVTPLHYDISHNCYVQIKGRKRVVIFPPESWQTLYLHPILHPGGLGTQVDLDADYSAQHRMFPFYAKGQVLGYEAILNAGDVLYIPPMWFHHVTSLEESVSLSVWSPFAGSELYAKVLAEAPLPIKGSWEDEMKVAGLRLLVDSLVKSLKVDGLTMSPEQDSLGLEASAFIRWTLLDSRYKRVKTAVPGAQDPFLYCWSRELEDQLLLEHEEFVTDGLKPVVTMFREIAEVSGDDRRNILLANYIELAVNSIVGVASTAAYLTALVEC